MGVYLSGGWYHLELGPWLRKFYASYASANGLAPERMLMEGLESDQWDDFVSYMDHVKWDYKRSLPPVKYMERFLALEREVLVLDAEAEQMGALKAHISTAPPSEDVESEYDAFLDRLDMDKGVSGKHISSSVALDTRVFSTTALGKHSATSAQQKSAKLAARKKMLKKFEENLKAQVLRNSGGRGGAEKFSTTQEYIDYARERDEAGEEDEQMNAAVERVERFDEYAAEVERRIDDQEARQANKPIIDKYSTEEELEEFYSSEFGKAMYGFVNMDS